MGMRGEKEEGKRERERTANIQGELSKEPVKTHSRGESVDQRGFPHRVLSLPRWSYVPLSPHCHSDPTTNKIFTV